MENAATAPTGHGPERDDASDDAVTFLRTLGAAEIEHPGGTLLEHLQRVSRLLKAWDARRDLQLAGLCHAFYGTDGFATSLLPLESRGELVGLIGADAEELVYFYASCDRKASYRTLTGEGGTFRDRFTGHTFSPAPHRRRDFAELTAANELDLAAIDPAFRTEWGDGLLGLLTRLRPLLSDEAWEHTRKVLT
ncbi:DUF6817 domain-containing protein [Streptomyces sp. RKAG293]|uniref:DUF6817 domain-containing protein n=1 Tax=Streptomyces sp. RKAG293 TaxID=2893403 RepID=UPI0020340347|nr:hypothetical protein [Streptomyces sp. RKAG293]MCM2423803.1 hypothetical protein [Streptomyces sp. RKAG293]